MLSTVILCAISRWWLKKKNLGFILPSSTSVRRKCSSEIFKSISPQKVFKSSLNWLISTGLASLANHKFCSLSSPMSVMSMKESRISYNQGKTTGGELAHSDRLMIWILQTHKEQPEAMLICLILTHTFVRVAMNLLKKFWTENGFQFHRAQRINLTWE